MTARVFSSALLPVLVLCLSAVLFLMPPHRPRAAAFFDRDGPPYAPQQPSSSSSGRARADAGPRRASLGTLAASPYREPPSSRLCSSKSGCSRLCAPRAPRPSCCCRCASRRCTSPTDSTSTSTPTGLISPTPDVFISSGLDTFTFVYPSWFPRARPRLVVAAALDFACCACAYTDCCCCRCTCTCACCYSDSDTIYLARS